MTTRQQKAAKKAADKLQELRDKVLKAAQEIRDKAVEAVKKLKAEADDDAAEIRDKADQDAEALRKKGVGVNAKANKEFMDAADETIAAADTLAKDIIKNTEAAAEKILADADKSADELISKSEETTEGLEIAGAAIHCSASNLRKHDNISVIDRWHKARGFKMRKPLVKELESVGYHYFIQANGKVQRGRRLDDDSILEWDEIGAHVLGKNRRLIGICLHGIDATDFTKAQFKTLEKLLPELPNFDKGFFKIYGHNYFTDKKTCPNYDWRAWVKDVFPDKLPDKENDYA